MDKDNYAGAKDNPFSEDSGILWHFTSQEGLPSILLGDDGLLAGHTSFMSDPEDCILRNRLWASLVKVVKGNPKEASEEEKIFAAVEERIAAGAFYPIFVACFTTDVHEKQMWTSRTQNGGFAIGFDKEMLLADIGRQSDDVFVKVCDYDTFEENKQKCDKLREDIAFFAGQEQDDKSRIAEYRRLKDECMKLVACKRRPLEWEQETRIVYSFPSALPEERIRYLGARPFVTMALKTHIRNYVKCIAVSPLGDVRRSLVLANFVAAAIGKEPDIVQEMDYFVFPRKK